MTPTTSPALPNWSTRSGVLRLHIAHDGRDWTLEPSGEIDLSNTTVLEQAIARADASAAESITIDLRRVQFIDLTGVRAIVSAHGQLQSRLRLLRGPSSVQSVFRLAGTEPGLPFE